MTVTRMLIRRETPVSELEVWIDGAPAEAHAFHGLGPESPWHQLLAAAARAMGGRWPEAADDLRAWVPAPASRGMDCLLWWRRSALPDAPWGACDLRWALVPLGPSDPAGLVEVRRGSALYHALRCLRMAPWGGVHGTGVPPTEEADREWHRWRCWVDVTRPHRLVGRRDDGAEVLLSAHRDTDLHRCPGCSVPVATCGTMCRGCVIDGPPPW